MTTSKVYYDGPRASTYLDSYALKARQVFEQGGFEATIKPGDLVAIKLHMGEAYNVGYLRPSIVRSMVDKVKELGGKPFVTDTTTMPFHPWNSRSLARDYLETANRNGFNAASMDCPVVIADGWLGTDDVVVDLQGRGNYLNRQFVARAIVDADVIISLAHFKGHPAGGFGGSIKNIGVGCASKRGKMNVHGALAGDKPVVHPERCTGKRCDWWEVCEACCPEGAITILDDGIQLRLEDCVYCIACSNLCINLAKRRALERHDLLTTFGRRIADSALACMLTMGERKGVFINFAIDISPVCDCYGWTDTPVVNNLGVFASWDPVAVDKACIDLMNAAPGLVGSAAEDVDALQPGAKKFEAIRERDVEIQIHGGVANGLGSAEYELVEVTLDKSPSYMKRIYPVVIGEVLRPMYKQNHPLRGVDCQSFGKPTEGIAEPLFPKK